MMKRWLLLAAARAVAEDLAFVREGCRISIHGARAILRDGARECDVWNAQSRGRRCASDRVLLCEVVFADQKAAASTHAALTVATDAAYLAAPIPGGLPRYKYVEACVEINQCVGCTDNSSLSHFSAMTRPSWLGRAVRNRHRHAIEQASRRWRGGRRERAVKF